MKFRSGCKSRKARIEIIPMIDVMFFLLATFMLASIAMQNYQGIAVNLAHGNANKISQKPSLILNINSKNQIFLNQKPVEIHNLSNAIQSEITDLEQLIVIAADKDSSQGTVISAMLAAKKVGGHHFSMIVESKE